MRVAFLSLFLCAGEHFSANGTMRHGCHLEPLQVQFRDPLCHISIFNFICFTLDAKWSYLFSMVIIPKNPLLFAVNALLACTSGYQLFRKVLIITSVPPRDLYEFFSMLLFVVAKQTIHLIYTKFSLREG